MIDVYVALAPDVTVHPSQDGTAGMHMECKLPFIPPPEQTFYPHSDFGGMRVVNVEATANREEATIIVDAGGWSVAALLDAGFQP